MSDQPINADREAIGADLCLVVPPFASVHFPQLGVAILKAACTARGLRVTNVHGEIELAARAGVDAYQAIAEGSMRALLGERLFRDLAYPPETLALIADPLPLSDALQAQFNAIEPHVAGALDAIVAQIVALRPRIVGLSSTFQQTLACAAIARRVKLALPDAVTVMGGANAAWPIAATMAKAFPWIDHFFAGEADLDFPDFCEGLVKIGVLPAERVIRSEPVRDMRKVFEPDFADFFAALRAHQATGALPQWLPRFVTAETSRGCWWGAKHHCTFCGLNGDGMVFRDKPVAQVQAALTALALRWQVDYIHLTDNIMPRHYVAELMPALAASESRLKLYYEVKANLSESQVDTMAAGGVIHIQPGIESLSSDVLRLMRKGVSAQQNVALLRHCRGVSIKVDWAILYGFPGEQAAAYEAMIALMPKLAHLQPPSGAMQIVIDRFSPYFKDPEGMGVGTLSPLPAYRALYPPDVDTSEVAFHFSGDYTTEVLGDPALVARLKAAVAAWDESWAGRKQPVLELFEAGGKGMVLDTRPIARRTMTVLSPAQHEALLWLEHPRSRAGLDPVRADHADWLVAHDFVLAHEDKLISLVVRAREAGLTTWRNWQEVSTAPAPPPALAVGA